MNVGNATLGAKFSACMRKHGVTELSRPEQPGSDPVRLWVGD